MLAGKKYRDRQRMYTSDSSWSDGRSGHDQRWAWVCWWWRCSVSVPMSNLCLHFNYYIKISSYKTKTCRNMNQNSIQNLKNTQPRLKFITPTKQKWTHQWTKITTEKSLSLSLSLSLWIIRTQFGNGNHGLIKQNLVTLILKKESL